MAEIAKYRAKVIGTNKTVEGWYSERDIKYKPNTMLIESMYGYRYITKYYITSNRGKRTEIDPSTIERVEDGCEYCNGIEKGDLGKALDEVDTEGEMRLYRTAADTWYIRSRRHTDDGDDLFSLFDTDRCFKCGKQLKGVEGK